MNYPDLSLSPDGDGGGGSIDFARRLERWGSPIQLAFGGMVDYAGWAPPAETSIEEAIANYAQYRQGPFAPMLGRLVLRAQYTDPATGETLSDLPVLKRYIDENSGLFAKPWQISLILPDPTADEAAFTRSVYLT